ncbi:Protein TOXD [Venustampulla echinocandica]|uniref:Protein TOXD n=1 Tax=Venustampulla echinocandica TaxID=2656787 RepID=A0A370U0C0_9HELO|nr:Protein TOXD [Venustampulla echinocandica]RDL41203.1 Protein TOXD [Venustampulla echinocandica]
MAVQKAIIIQEPGKAIVVTDAPVPVLRDDYVLIKNIAVAINPTDWGHVEHLADPGSLVGCDYAGIVEEVGKAVTRPFKKGDRIAGFAHGANTVQHQDGSFAEYIVAKGDVQMAIPENVSLEEAATFGVGICTVGQGLYQSLQLAMPHTPLSEPVPILIYGGSTATGTLAIQFAKLSGYTVITTCSPRNFDLVKARGADTVFNYAEPGAALKIRELTHDKLTLVFDTISTNSSAEFCGEALSSAGGRYAALSPVQCPRSDVQSTVTMAYTIIGEDFNFGPNPIPASAENLEFGKIWLPLVEKLIAEGKVKAHPLKVGKDGLEGVLEGMQFMKEGKVSGEKLVYWVGETP